MVRISAGSGQDLKNLEIASVWSSARHNDCSREILQCGCNLRRSPVVLPLAFPSEQLRRRPSAFGRERGDLFNTQNKSLPRRSSKATRRTIVVLLLCALRKNFQQMFSCLRRSDHDWVMYVCPNHIYTEGNASA